MIISIAQSSPEALSRHFVSSFELTNKQRNAILLYVLECTNCGIYIQGWSAHTLTSHKHTLSSVEAPFLILLLPCWEGAH